MNSISDYLTVTTPLPQYLPYARFLLDTDLSYTAKLLYTLLLDRATLSQKNHWVDAQGRIYVVYPLSSLAKDLGCSISSITRSFTELENAQLVERVRNGFSKPRRILLKADFSGLDSLIEQLSAYIQSTGKKYADHAATLRIWAKRQKAEQKSKPGIPDYTFKEGESL